MNNIFIFVSIIIIIFGLIYLLFIKKIKSLNKTNSLIKESEITLKKRKIALCISGKINNIKDCYNNWNKNIIMNNDVDIFICCNTPSKNDINYIKNVIKPKKYVFYDKNVKNISKYWYENFSNMIYKIYLCNNLRLKYQKQKKIKYDYIIKLRPDLIFHKPIYTQYFDKYPETLFIPKKIKNSKSIYGDMTNIYGLGITDQLFICNDKIMNRICDLYKNLKYYKYISCKLPEVILLRYCKDNKIKIKLFNLDWDIKFYLQNTYYSNKKWIKKIPHILDRSCFINMYLNY